MDYQVTIDTFHGPLDLLFYLVKRHEVDILDIPIAQITEQFLHYLQVIEQIDFEAAGDFLVMAATLMEIKSKLLVVNERDEPIPEEEDPRRELVRQLMEYRKFKDAATLLEQRAEEQQRLYTRLPVEEPAATSQVIPVRQVELWDLVSAFGRLMRETAALQPRQIIVDDTPQHVYEELILTQLRTHGRVGFRALFTPPYYRSRLVGLFLAMLELIKQRKILLEQENVFAEIWLSLRPIENTAAA